MGIRGQKLGSVMGPEQAAPQTAQGLHRALVCGVCSSPLTWESLLLELRAQAHCVSLSWLPATGPLAPLFCGTPVSPPASLAGSLFYPGLLDNRW